MHVLKFKGLLRNLLLSVEYGEKIGLLKTHCCLETVKTGVVGILQSGCVWSLVGFWWASVVSGSSNVFRDERIAGRELGRGGYSRFRGGWSSDLSAAAGRPGHVFSPAGWAHSSLGTWGWGVVMGSWEPRDQNSMYVDVGTALFNFLSVLIPKTG